MTIQLIKPSEIRTTTGGPGIEGRQSKAYIGAYCAAKLIKT